MQPISTTRNNGSTRGFVTLDPERQGVLPSSLRRAELRASASGKAIFRPPRARSEFIPTLPNLPKAGGR